MRRGTTPINTFEVDVDLSGAEVLFITYRQQGRVVCEKTIEDITFTPKTEQEPDKVSVQLTQLDTLKMRHGNVEIQIRARYPTGEAIASQIMVVPVDAILKDGVI